MKQFLVFVLASLFVLTSCSTNEDVGSGGSGAPDEMGEATPKHMVPTFNGSAQDGSVFTTENVAGKPWVASFFFTTCTTVCPAQNTILKNLRSELGNGFKIVSVSSDPLNDTGKVLADYARSYNARVGDWWMVTMPREEMMELAGKGLKLIEPEQPAMHSTRLVAVNKNMEIEGYFDSEDNESIQRLREWIQSQL